MLQNVVSINLIYLIYLLCKKIFKICALNDIVICVHFYKSYLCVLYSIIFKRMIGWKLYNRNNFGRKRSDFEQTVIGTWWYGVMRVDWMILHEW